MKKPTLKQLLIAKKSIKQQINNLRREIYAIDKEIDKKL
jgi:hypothetical protein